MKRVIKKMAHKLAPGAMASLEAARSVPHVVERLAALDQKVDKIHEEVSFHDNRLVQLKALAAQVEPYQPAYGIAEAIDCPRRSSQDRCIAIENAIRPLAGKRILDIGSSLGYVSFYMTDRGAKVQGWDLSAKNIEVSRLIGGLNGIRVDFKVKKIDASTVATIPKGSFDTAIILSVFHHIVHHQGLAATQRLVRELLDRVPVLIVELAKKGEDKKLFWDAAQPKDELAIFDLVKEDIEIKRIGEFSNHLSAKTRPLYMVTKKASTKVGVHEYVYDYSTTAAYKDSPVANVADIHRRYYFAKDYIVKEYGFEKDGDQENLYQIIGEVNAFVNVLGRYKMYHAPEMLDFAINDFGAKIVVKRIAGELLSDLPKPLSDVRLVKVAHDILKTLADLEVQGLYHNDVRSWNVIYNSQGAWLIDYGLMASRPSDNDAISLLWTLAAVRTQERESYQVNKATLPKAALFTHPKLKKLYALVKGGQYSPTQLLKAFEA